MNSVYTSIEELMKKLVVIESDTGTNQEQDVENYICEWFSNLAYFKDNSDFFGKYEIENDTLGRKIAWALVKGEGTDTIIFMNHHDVVDSYDYGELRKSAYCPENLKKNLSKINFNDEINEDLKDENWIFGRGTADMKAGAAIQMMIIKEYTEKSSFKGNLLFISVPDEENLSLGMRNAAILLNEIKEKFSLDYKLVINSEPHNRDKKDEFLYYDSSVGKIMMTVYVKGKKTHMGEIFEGLNPTYILSKIVGKTEMNTYFSDEVNGIISPPPAWGFVRDFKERYDVSIPEAAGGYINFLTLNRTIESIFSDLKTICSDACKEVYDKVNDNYKFYKKDKKAEFPIKARVLLYQELVEEAKDFNEELVIKELDKKMKEIQELLRLGKITLVKSNFMLIKTLLNIIPNKEPIVVISMSPPYYPFISNDNIKKLDDKIKNINEKISDFTNNKLGLKSKNKKTFMGISDLSYLDFQAPIESASYVKENMPLWWEIYQIPFESMKKLAIPAINIGPWGKDIHKMTERVNREDLNKNIPKIINYIIDYIL